MDERGRRPSGGETRIPLMTNAELANELRWTAASSKTLTEAQIKRQMLFHVRDTPEVQHQER